MKKYMILGSILLLILIISGCSSNKEKTTDDKLQAIKVMIQTQPEKLKSNEEVKIQALVTYGEEKVNDANEVAFELWKKGQEEHEIINAESKGEGIYESKTTFSDDGIYYVIAHVTARDMHSMPKKELIIGNPAQTEPAPQNDSEHGHDGTDEELEHEHGSEETHGHPVAIELTQNSWIINQESTLHATIKHDNALLTEATVRFEVWFENNHTHQFINATEVEDGKYEAKTTFDQQGKYIVKVHVEKEDIHDHKELELVVEKLK